MCYATSNHWRTDWENSKNEGFSFGRLSIDSLFEAQVINYLRATGLQVALLINFGQKELQVKRIAANIY